MKKRIRTLLILTIVFVWGGITANIDQYGRIENMTVTRKVYFDWDKDGSFTDMSASVISVSGTIGRADWKSRVAEVGICMIELKNDLRHFTPENAASPYFGQMVPDIPVRVEVEDGLGTHRIFTVWTTDFNPQPDQFGTLRCTVNCHDRMGQLQDADLSLPIQNSQQAGPILKRLTSTVYESGQATATIYMRNVADADLLSVDTTTYTFKDTLTPVANEIALESQDYFFDEGIGGGGITDAAVNAAAAINRDERNGTDYAAATGYNSNVTALGYMGIGWDESNYDTDYDLQRTGTAYEALAASFSFAFSGDYSEPVTMPMRRVYLYLKKVGNPTGTLTLRHETPTGAGGSPSGSLYNASGIQTMDESDLTTSFAWVAFDFPAQYNMDNFSLPAVSNLHWLVLSTDRATSGTDYVVWGGDSAFTIARFSDDTKTGGSWAGRTPGQVPLIFIPGLLDLTASAHGAWGNDIVLSAETVEYHLGANPTINTGSIISGSYTDTITQNGVSLVLAEVGGTPGFDYEFPVTISGTGDHVGIWGHYDGNAFHTVNVEAYNGATWDILGTLPDAATDAFYSFTLTPSHTIGGVVTIRIQHTDAGNPNHELHLDHFYVISDTPSGISTMELSSETLEGGVDGPVGAISADDGILTFDYAGDTWIEGDTNALTGGADLADSEFGLLFAKKDGTITFENQQYEFEQTNSTPEMVCDDAHSGQTGSLTKANIINRATISYQPRAVLASGVIAKANAPFFITGVAQDIVTPRWNSYETTKNPVGTGERTVVLPYVTDATGNLVGGIAIEQPLVAGTDYELWGTKDKTGPEVTDKKLIKFALALVGSGVQVQMRNTVNRWGWVHDLQVRGKALYRQNTTQDIREDSTSRSAYGLRPYEFTLPFPSADIENFAEVLAWYFINRFKDPLYIVDTISFRGTEAVGGVSVFSLDIGDVIDLSETQTAVANFKMMILGIETLFPENDVHEVTFLVTRLNSDTYWELGVVGFSELGETTVLAL
jgi:hypothetical protein